MLESIHGKRRWLSQVQCDQMNKLYFQYLAIFSNENVPNSIQIVAKWVVNFTQKQINLKYIAKDFQLIATVVEFRQIWSHCSGPWLDDFTQSWWCLSMLSKMVYNFNLWPFSDLSILVSGQLWVAIVKWVERERESQKLE